MRKFGPDIVNPPLSNPAPPPSPAPQGPESKAAFRRCGWLLRPVRLAGCRGPWHFVLRLTIQKWAANLVVAVPLALVGSNGHHPVVDTDFSMPQAVWRAALALVVVAPLLETLFLQAVPIETAKALRLSRMVQFLAGAIPFAAIHFSMGIKVGIVAGTVGGLFLSHAYLEGRARSVWSALWITMVIHFLHNATVMVVLLLAMRDGF